VTPSSTPAWTDFPSTDLALWLGQHGLAFWALGCLSALALTGLLWRLRRRLGPGALWFGAALPAALLLAALASQIGPGHALPRFDEALTASLARSVPPTTLAWFTVPTWLGNPAPVAVLAVLVALWLGWRRQRALAGIWLLAVIGNTVLNWGLKQLFARQRPTPLDGLLHETGYSFPSGHASGVLVTYGTLAYLVLRLAPARWHLPVLLATVLLVVSAPMSRVFLQVHYASDVLAGLCSGTLWLLLCLRACSMSRTGRVGAQSG